MSHHKSLPEIFQKRFLSHSYFGYCLITGKTLHRHTEEKTDFPHNHALWTAAPGVEKSSRFAACLRILEKYCFRSIPPVRCVKINIHSVTGRMWNPDPVSLCVRIDVNEA